jgi:hypothetical protein
MAPPTSGQKIERWVGYAVLVCLAGVVAGVGVSQFTFNPAVTLTLELSRDQAAPPPQRLPAAVPEPPGLLPLNKGIIFSPQTLSDKINGKAELYLSSGFVELHTRRFALPNAPGDWAEIFVYDMGDPRNAFAVFSLQKRDSGHPLAFTTHAYRTENGVYWTHGKVYVEMIGSTVSDALVTPLLQAAAAFTRNTAAQDGAMQEAELFPAAGKIAGSVKLIAANGFGYDQLNQVFIAKYETEGEPMTAFLSTRATRQEAKALADGYLNFLLMFGGEEIAISTTGGAWRIIKIFDTYEVVSAQGKIFAGVREAADQNAALVLAGQMERELDRHGK